MATFLHPHLKKNKTVLITAKIKDDYYILYITY